MQVELDNGRKSVTIDVTDTYQEKFLHVVFKALRALDYRPEDIIRELENFKEEYEPTGNKQSS